MIKFSINSSINYKMEKYCFICAENAGKRCEIFSLHTTVTDVLSSTCLHRHITPSFWSKQLCRTRELEEQLASVSTERSGLAGQVKSLLDQVESLQALVDEGRSQVDSLTERNTQLQRQLQEYTQRNAELLRQVSGCLV